MVNIENFRSVLAELSGKASLVAVSKTKPAEDILALYEIGQRDFGENYVQELVQKAEELPKDIRWHFIGHLQTNKVKYIAPFVHLIHGIDSFRLLREVNKQAARNNRVISCLLQVHIASEETKFGLDEKELEEILITKAAELEELKNVRVRGLMGMASFTAEMEKVRLEFQFLKSLFDKYSHLQLTNYESAVLSMGMSSDYLLALEEGSTMVRVGSLLFGAR